MFLQLKAIGPKGFEIMNLEEPSSSIIGHNTIIHINITHTFKRMDNVLQQSPLIGKFRPETEK